MGMRLMEWKWFLFWRKSALEAQGKQGKSQRISSNFFMSFFFFCSSFMHFCSCFHCKIEYQILRLSLHFVHSFIHGILIFNHQISHDIAQVGEGKRKISILQFSDTYSLDNNFLDLQFEQFYFSINTSEKQEN